VPSPADSDGRAAIKSRHRAAIVAAARRLIEERGSQQVTVEEIAGEAEVSRRTVFNHFASLDDIRLVVCEQMVEHVLRGLLLPLGPGLAGEQSAEVTFEAFATAVRGADLPELIVIARDVFGDGDHNRARARSLAQSVYDRVGERMLAELSRHRGSEPPLDIRLLVTSLMHGVEVIARQWVEETDASLAPHSRERWARLCEQLLRQVGHGFLATDLTTDVTADPTAHPEQDPTRRTRARG
jgi:TetR/AcrR family transcriptional regulator of autoinduction and epiphytic fitness